MAIGKVSKARKSCKTMSRHGIGKFKENIKVT
ncbi:hypothetical protein F383_32219 [Gossypium arboreum]|uniref:Uncharacterized protein n=1 Tax=Gossypium arboreum TaxID=29729 RepID=A0A0B0PM62_GOSAR|nr:hypothetical protein F383_32219 [Gossypium arboreum]